jgi:hypothetical protein
MFFMIGCVLGPLSGISVFASDEKDKQPKNVYSYIKSQKKENTSIAPLRSEGVLHADPTEKANILNRQFQSAFSISPEVLIYLLVIFKYVPFLRFFFLIICFSCLLAF